VKKGSGDKAGIERERERKDVVQLIRPDEMMEVIFPRGDPGEVIRGGGTTCAVGQESERATRTEIARRQIKYVCFRGNLIGLLTARQPSITCLDAF